MYTMQGETRRASAKRLRTRDAPTPTNISWKLDPDAERKGTPASVATARASSVLPVPGAPVSSTPRGARPPSRPKRSGLRRNSTVSASASLTSSIPATSEKRTGAGVPAAPIAAKWPLLRRRWSAR